MAHTTTKQYISALEELGYKFRMNACNDDLEVNGVPITDPMRAELRTAMRDKGFERVNVMEDAYIAHALKNSFHPVKDYLWNLQYDGHDHISDVASCFSDERNVFALWFRKWLIGCVMRVCDDGAQNPMLVLDGKQGVGKSSFVQWLASPLPEYFVEAPIDPSNKDDYIRLVSTWIWEVAELGSTARRADREALKHFISMRRVTVRKAYGRYDIRKPALASFIGTVNNESGILSDPTGNRRFLICKLSSIDWNYSELNPAKLWAQAMHLYANEHETNVLTRDECEMSTAINEEYEMENPVAGMLEKYFDIDPSECDWWTSSTDVLEELTEHGLVGNPRANQMLLSAAAIYLHLIRAKRDTPQGRRVWGYIGLRPTVQPVLSVQPIISGKL